MNIIDYIKAVLKKLQMCEEDTEEFVRILKVLRDTLNDTIEKMEKI